MYSEFWTLQLFSEVGGVWRFRSFETWAVQKLENKEYKQNSFKLQARFWFLQRLCRVQKLDSQFCGSELARSEFLAVLNSGNSCCSTVGGSEFLRI